MEEKIINMNQFLGAAQGDQEHMLGKFLYFSLCLLYTSHGIRYPKSFAL